jgi:hypothetical protein
MHRPPSPNRACIRSALVFVPFPYPALYKPLPARSNLSYVGPIDCESKLSPNLMAASSNGSDGKEAGPDNDSKDKLCLKYCRM